MSVEEPKHLAICWFAEDEHHWFKEFADAISAECPRLEIQRLRSVEEANSAIVALREGRTPEPSVVVTNLNLNGRDNTTRHGVDLLRAVRDVSSRIPVIALTARRDWREAEPGGFTAVIQKSDGAAAAAKAICQLAFPTAARSRRQVLTRDGSRELGIQAELLEREVQLLLDSSQIPTAARRDLEAIALQLSGWRLGSDRSPLAFGVYLTQVGTILSQLSISIESPDGWLTSLIRSTVSVSDLLVEPDDKKAADSVNSVATEAMKEASKALNHDAKARSDHPADSALDKAETWVSRWERACSLGKRSWRALPLSIRAGVPVAALAVRFYEAVSTYLLHAFR